MKDVIKGSAMRFNLFLSGLGAFIMMLSVATYVVICAFKGCDIQWEAMGIFAVGVASVVTGASWTKAKQKEVETKNEEKE